MDWKKLKKYHLNAPTKGLPRKTHMNVKYGKLRQKLKEEGKSMRTHILESILGRCPNDKLIITKNLFPYDLDPAILHLVVWVNPIFNKLFPGPESVIGWIEGHGLSDFILFENIDEVKSIKDIKHYQLFIKEKEKNKLRIGECF